MRKGRKIFRGEEKREGNEGKYLEREKVWCTLQRRKKTQIEKPEIIFLEEKRLEKENEENIWRRKIFTLLRSRGRA